MERRKDYRHVLAYRVSLQCPRTRRVIDGVLTESVSASGLSFRSDLPHGLEAGARLELQLIAPVDGQVNKDMLVMATHGTIVRAEGCSGALRFDAPLTY